MSTTGITKHSRASGVREWDDREAARQLHVTCKETT